MWKEEFGLAAYKGIDNQGRVLIDFNGVQSSLFASAIAHQMHKAMKKENPFFNLLGGPRKYENPEDMLAVINEYFDSCFGPKLNKFGDIVYDRATDKPLYEKVRPFTRTGLILYLGMQERNFYDYINKSRDGLIPPGFYEIMKGALLRIESQAEEYLYGQHTQRGAEFYLRVKAKWQSPKEMAETDRVKAQTRLAQEEFDLKKKLLDDSDGDNELVVQIVRKVKKDEED